jgi:hypothetical protein
LWLPNAGDRKGRPDDFANNIINRRATERRRLKPAFQPDSSGA